MSLVPHTHSGTFLDTGECWKRALLDEVPDLMGSSDKEIKSTNSVSQTFAQDAEEAQRIPEKGFAVTPKKPERSSSLENVSHPRP